MSAETADTPVTTGAIRNWLPIVLALATVAAGGFASYLQLKFELEAVQARLGLIETNGTDHTRAALARVKSLEDGAAETQRVMREQGVTLERVDRRLGLLLCRTDRRYCDVER